MSDPTTVTAVTNPKPNSCVEVKCDCPTMWSFVQQDCYIRMGSITADMVAAPIKDYETRAKRIAGTYARFYLETERGGDPKKKGRFYWMALGAFASKTVACTYADWRVGAQEIVTSATKEGLGRGNLWLFCDIAGWHWYYTQFNDSFEQCLASRDTSKLVPAVIKQTKNMPWRSTALPKIKNLKVSKEIKLAFAKVKEFETQSKKEARPALQLEHLLIVADHEQGVILQPLVYDDPDFAYWVRMQRRLSWVTPTLQLVFSRACDIGDGAKKSIAPGNMKLEEFKSRMAWITKAADQFHGLMQTDKAYMEGEIAAMAGWYDMADKK